MQVGIIGAGKVGTTLGEAWAAAGHVVRYGSREPVGREGFGTHADVVAWADAVVIALPGAAVAEVVAGLGKALDAKLVIDASNRVGADVLNSFGAIAAAAPGARLQRAFSTLGWELMAQPVVAGEQSDLFYCGDPADQASVERLISDVGFRPVRVGGPEAADVVDGTARLWFALALAQGMGRRLAFRMLHERVATA
jgi:predicted dinucleotide-binding enzyme